MHIIAAASALVSAGAALVDTDIKRIVAYSTVSQIGFIFLGLATGSAVGAVGALLYILMHGLAKAGLFLSAGIVEQNAGTKDITKLGGLLRTMPVTAVAFLLCAFSVMGIPPLGGFFGKYMVVSSAVDTGQRGHQRRVHVRGHPHHPVPLPPFQPGFPGGAAGRETGP